MSHLYIKKRTFYQDRLGTNIGKTQLQDRVSSGLVLDSGECITSAFPVFAGTIDKHAVKSIPFGGRDVTEYVKRQMSLDMNDYATNQIACRMKVDLCYCGRENGIFF